MKKPLLFAAGILAVGLLIRVSHADTVNPASAVTADSANTASTIVYRDSSGNFAAGTMTGSVTATAGSVAVSTSATSNFPMKFKGAYTSTQLATLSANPGEIVWNTTIFAVCGSSASTTALPGAWVLNRSTATNANLTSCTQ